MNLFGTTGTVGHVGHVGQMGHRTRKGKNKKVKGDKIRLFSASLRLCGLFLLLTAYCLPLTAQTRDFTRHVNPFIGTGGHGHTFPGATMPFGMVQLSPDTRIDNWDGSSGYHYSDDIIYGFSHTHLSGTGIPDGCDILIMPTVGNHKLSPDLSEKNHFGWVERFSHTDEKAEPGFYSLKILNTNILAELTSTKRVGLHRYTFPKAGSVNIILDLSWRDKETSSQMKIVGKNRVEGFRQSTSWAKKQKVYFVAEFAKPIGDFSSNAPPSDSGIQKYGISNNFYFKIAQNEPILVKVAVSYVSIEGARKNLEAELPHWDFDKVRADAKAAWNKELSKIEVSGGTADQTTNFYTALYHTMIHPNVFNDVDGKYKGHDGKVHSLGRGEGATQGRSDKNGPGVSASHSPALAPDHYTVFSLWDTFRAAHPLYTIIDQKRTVDFINSFIRIYEQGGRLPVWELWGEETDTMIGYHAVSVIADAMAKGIKGFDYEKAYTAAKHSAELDHFGLAAYKRRGYISMEDENESVSRTLEYAYNDWCIAQMAKLLLARRNAGSLPASAQNTQAGSLRSDIETYSRRARSFENLWDKRTGFFRPKKNGAFVAPFGPSEVNFAFTEGNSWQYSFFVPHDVSRLMELRGGKDKFVDWLDELFNTEQKLTGREQADLTGLIGQYAHGNEPSHHIAYLYNYAGQPWKTQKMVRRIMDEFYANKPDGLIGNEDCGQMSAWYVMSALGFYQVNPGGMDYAIGSPLFPRAMIRLENGKTFTITSSSKPTPNPPAGPSLSLAPQPPIYIASAKLNGLPHRRSFFTHADLTRGGTLAFEMTGYPTEQAFTEAPVSKMDVETPIVPLIEAPQTFADATAVWFHAANYERIYYTVDGTEPTADSTKYTGPFVIDRTTRFKIIAVSDSGRISPVVESVITRRPNNYSAKITSGYSTQYTGGGDNGIIDGIRGTTNFASGEWQGIQGKPYEAVIDLQKEMTVSKVGGGFLQVASPWIWMPSRIEFETSLDGVNFSKVADIKTDVAVTDMKPQIRDYVTTITPITARYVRVRAHNIGKIPSWHPGAGGDPWIFVDEIFIQ